MPALKYSKTEVNTSDAWDASKVEAALPAGAQVYQQAYAWSDSEGDAEQRNSYRFPHHFVNEDGTVGAASAEACKAAIEQLNSRPDGLTDEDLQAVRNHLAAHLKDADIEAPQLNGVSQDGQHSEKFRIEANSFEDDGQGTLAFPNGQVVMDSNTLRSGYRYDIESMDLTEFNGSVTEDHDRAVRSIVAKTSFRKQGDAIVMDRLQFAIKENPIAQVVYDLYRNGYAKDFSIETFGPWPDEEGIFYKAKVIGHSCVVVGNSRSATVNSLIKNSLATARDNGLDISETEQKLGVHVEQASTSNQEEDMKYVTVKNGRDFAVEVSYKNAAGEEVNQSLAPGASLDVSDDQQNAVEKQLADAKNETAALTPADLTKAVDEALARNNKEHEERLAKIEKAVIDNSAAEPAWRKAKGGQSTANTAPKDMEWRDRTAVQLQSILGSLKGNPGATEKLYEINSINLEELQKEGMVSNALDLPDLGNFVIPKEMITEIKEQVSNYTPLLNLFRFEETLSLDTAWLTGTGEIDMEDVDMNDANDDADLKPIKYPSFDTETTTLKEFAAVTPIKSSAIRFAAVDLVGHLTKLYRRAYDRRLAQSVIGRLELAVEGNGNVVPYNYSSTVGGDVEALVTLITAWSEVAEHSPNGVYLLTQQSYGHLFAMALRAGTNGPLANIFTTGPNGIQNFLGRPYAVVPSDLMPALNTGSTKSWSFEGQSVTVNSGVFYADPNDFVGRVSGGLNFQVSDVASYEESGNFKSAYQRDELVFRGYGYRASGLYFPQNVSAVSAPGIS